MDRTGNQPISLHPRAKPKSHAVICDEYILEDKPAQLASHIDSINETGPYDDVVVKLLERAIALKSLQCIQVLLSRVRSLKETDDLCERNVLHKYIINFGSCQTKLVRSTPDDISILRTLLEGTPESLRSSLLARDVNGRMPLHYAALYGLYEACNLWHRTCENGTSFKTPYVGTKLYGKTQTDSRQSISP